jgi:hypothetical protein
VALQSVKEALSTQLSFNALQELKLEQNDKPAPKPCCKASQPDNQLSPQVSYSVSSISLSIFVSVMRAVSQTLKQSVHSNAVSKPYELSGSHAFSKWRRHCIGKGEIVKCLYI